MCLDGVRAYPRWQQLQPPILTCRSGSCPPVCVYVGALVLLSCPTQPLQVLEITAREGTLACSQLEEAKKRLCSTQNQLEAMSDSHVKTLSRLETAKVSLVPSSGTNCCPITAQDTRCTWKDWNGEGK